MKKKKTEVVSQFKFQNNYDILGRDVRKKGISQPGKYKLTIKLQKEKTENVTG